MNTTNQSEAKMNLYRHYQKVSVMEKVCYRVTDYVSSCFAQIACHLE